MSISKKFVIWLASLIVVFVTMFVVAYKTNMFMVTEIPIVLDEQEDPWSQTLPQSKSGHLANGIAPANSGPGSGLDSNPSPSSSPSSSSSSNMKSAFSPQLESEIRARLTPFVHEPIWKIDLRALQHLILSFGWIKNVRISRILPNKVRLAIEPKRPVFLFVSPLGKVLPVLDDATILGTDSPALLADVPLLRGEKVSLDVEQRKRAIAAFDELPEHGPLAKRNIAEMSFASDTGYSVLLISSHLEIKLGEEHIATKAARVSQVLDYLNANHLKGRVIDASFSKKVLVRLRKDP